MTHTSIQELLNAARLNGLLTTRSGRIVAQVSRPNAAGNAYRSELVELAGGVALPLTRGDSSVGAAVPAEDGTTYFTAKRTGEDGKEADDAQLWGLPPRGEAREMASRTDGFGPLALGDGVLIAELSVHSQADSEAEHEKLSKIRSDAKVSAVLHDGFPTRYWNEDLGPARTVLAAAKLPADLATAKPTRPSGAEATKKSADDEASAQLLHFSYAKMPPGHLDGWTANPAGTLALVTTMTSPGDLLGVGSLYLVDLRGEAEPRLIAPATAQTESYPGAFSPDGSSALVGAEAMWTQEASLNSHTQVLDVETGTLTPLWPEHDFWLEPQWLDNEHVVASSDDNGRGSLWLGGVNDAAPERLGGGPGQDLSFGTPQVSGGRVIVSASGIGVAPHPLAIGPADGGVTELPNPADALAMPGTLREVSATGTDGTPIRAWLRVPEGQGPHPLVVFAHGGPWNSWNAWTYRWNPNPFVAAGYAVLLPDPAISTGYGQDMIDRGQQELGGAPYTDIMALTDAALAEADIDAERTAFAGGSYGGYMANWVAGHTGNRFKCIVTHASLWNTDSMGHTTDNSGWEAPMRAQNPIYSPHLFVEQITAPMLVIHGDKDYRVPISQGHSLWYDLLAFSATPKDTEDKTQHRFLYFPDEGHWIMGRGNAEIWYSTFIAFLDQHVKGKVIERPSELG